MGESNDVQFVFLEPLLPDVPELPVETVRERSLAEPFDHRAHLIAEIRCDEFLVCVVAKHAKLVFVTVDGLEPELEQRRGDVISTTLRRCQQFRHGNMALDEKEPTEPRK